MESIRKNPLPWIIGGVALAVGVWFVFIRKESFRMRRPQELGQTIYNRFPRTPDQALGLAKNLSERAINSTEIGQTIYNRFPRTPAQAIMGTVGAANDFSDRSIALVDRAVGVLPKKVGDIIGRDFSATKGRRGGLFGTLAGWNGGIIGKITAPWRD